MSKCECCKEKNSDLITYKGYKMCPTCYMGYVRKVKVCENNAKYEAEIDQLKQQLKEIKDECDLYKKFADGGAIDLVIESVGRLREIEKLKQQLAEKDKRIAELENENGYILFEDGYDENGKEVHRQVYTTYQQAFNEQVLETKKLRRQLKEKDKEIERLKSEIVKECKEHQEFIKEAKQITNQLKSNYQTQLAISELEEVKTLIQNAINFEKPNFVEVYDTINKQINDLRGEKDVED